MQLLGEEQNSMSMKGEKYSSKKAMMKHEKNEGPGMRKQESAKGMHKMPNGKMMLNSAMKKSKGKKKK